MWVDRSGWKSSQAMYTSGAFGTMGAQVTVLKERLDWSRVGGAVLEGGETCSNMWEGGLYCPGEELPRYYDREFKPRCSRWRGTQLGMTKEVGVIMMDKEKDMVDMVPVGREAEQHQHYGQPVCPGDGGRVEWEDSHGGGRGRASMWSQTSKEEE